jgi:LL-diaminopimelate aminotransferase
MSKVETFRGYGPENGYPFLRMAIAQGDFASRSVDIDPSEIFVSDGAKCDTGNFQELFDQKAIVAVQDPVYPVYVDTNVMAGRSGENQDGRYSGLVYMECLEERGYLPELPKEDVDLIYLCFPNNPTGTTATKEYLKTWVDFAKEKNALILFDAAYATFVRDPEIPLSIYEVEGAKEVAVEFRSFSKTAGFTGLRCAYTVVPKQCRVFDSKGKTMDLYPLWNRRHATKFNGVSYPVQCAAAAVYSDEGQAQVKELADYYLANAARIREVFTQRGYACVGGDNSPYVWINGGQDSWEIFELLLRKAGVVCTPGVGFGNCGQGHIRISAFNSKENVEEALERIAEVL